MEEEKDEKPYNRIVLIGNGFDKALGLKTSYSEFIFNYIQRSILETITTGKNEENELISLKWQKKYRLQNHEDEYVKQFKILKTVKELFDHVKQHIEISYKNDFFESLINEINDTRWVDIERLYYEFLKKKISVFKYQKEKYDSRDISDIISLNESMEILRRALNKFISEQQNAISIDYQNCSMQSLFDKFQLPLLPDQANLVFRHERIIPPAVNIFLNFNYTDTVINMLNHSFVKISNKHIHIHGSVNDKKNPIIFGYGDDTGEVYREHEELGENELLKKIKSFQYPRTTNYHKLLNYLEGGEFDVFIVGHSCGITDKTLLKTIFEHDNCLAIQNFHYKGEPEDFDKRMEISRHFTNKVLMRERVLPYDENATIPQIEN